MKDVHLRKRLLAGLWLALALGPSPALGNLGPRLPRPAVPARAAAASRWILPTASPRWVWALSGLSEYLRRHRTSPVLARLAPELAPLADLHLMRPEDWRAVSPLTARLPDDLAPLLAALGRSGDVSEETLGRLLDPVRRALRDAEPEVEALTRPAAEAVEGRGAWRDREPAELKELAEQIRPLAIYGPRYAARYRLARVAAGVRRVRSRSLSAAASVAAAASAAAASEELPPVLRPGRGPGLLLSRSLHRLSREDYKLAAGGDAPAQFRLAVYHEAGLGSRSARKGAAYYWYSRVLENPKQDPMAARQAREALRALEERGRGELHPGPMAALPRPATVGESWRRKRELMSVVGSVTLYPAHKQDPVPARVRMVADPLEGFLAKIMMIREARSTVDLATFILKRDAAGYAILHELREAIRRGVSVRVMVDAAGSLKSFPHAELKALLAVEPGWVRDKNGLLTGQRASVEVVVFNSLANIRAVLSTLWRKLRNFVARSEYRLGDVFQWWNRRMHDKILAVDLDDPARAVAMVGGRNIGERYFGLQKSGETINDFEMIVRDDPSAPSRERLRSTLGEHFDRLYYHLGNKVLRPSYFAARDRAELERMARASEELLGSGTPARARLEELEAAGYLSRGLAQADAEFLHEIQNLTRRNVFLNPEPERNPRNRPNGNSIVENFSARLAEARSSVFIASPYLLLSDRESEQLRAWLEADPSRRLTLLTNSAASSDHPLVQALSDLRLEKGIVKNPAWDRARSQVKVLAYGRPEGQPPKVGLFHGKVVLIDGRLTLVGSANPGNPRSRYLSSELAFLVHSEEAAAEVARYAAALEAGSAEWGGQDWKRLRRHPRFWLRTVLHFLAAQWLRLAWLPEKLV